MTLLRPMFIFLFFSFCITAFAQTQQNVTDTPFAQKDTAYWVYNFRQFRDAVYQADKTKARAFVDLPISRDYDNVWEVVFGIGTPEYNVQGGKGGPFGEADFYKYFYKLFNKEFINCLLKIKTDELYKTGEYMTTRFNDSLSKKSYWMNARWDKPSNTLMLYVNSRNPYKDESGEGISELAIIYIFEIAKKGHIKLTGISIAG